MPKRSRSNSPKNARNQANQTGPTNKPAALRALMQYWKGIAPTAASLPLDIDGNGSCDAATDATLAMRYMSGLRGPALTQGINIGSGATRTTPAEIATYLNGLGLTLDIDGDGFVNPLTDGLLFWRYAASPSGSVLTNFIRAPLSAPGARSDNDILSYLNVRCVAP